MWRREVRWMFDALRCYWLEVMSGASSASRLRLTMGNWNCGRAGWLLFICVHGRIVHSDPEVETPQVSIDRWMDKQIVVIYTYVCTYNGIWLGHKEEWSTETGYNWVNLKNMMLSERSQTQKATYFMILWNFHRARRQVSGCLRGRGKVEGRMSSDCLMGMGSPFGVMKVFWN